MNFKFNILFETLNESPYTGTSYYRLRQTGFDGRFSYSKVIAVSISRIESSPATFFPNPAAARITITGSELMLRTINIYDPAGQDVTGSTKIIHRSEDFVVIDLTDLRPGIHIVRTGATAGKVHKL